MTEEKYALYDNNTKKLIGLGRNAEMADVVINGFCKPLDIDVAAEPISQDEYVRLREEQNREIMGNFPQDILNRGAK